MASRDGWGGRRVTELRAKWRRRIATEDIYCAICRGIILPGMSFDIDHGEARVYGTRDVWDESNHWPAHSRCNRRAGQKISVRRATARKWYSAGASRDWSGN